MRHQEGILEVLILMTFLYLSMFINDNNEIFYIKNKKIKRINMIKKPV